MPPSAPIHPDRPLTTPTSQQTATTSTHRRIDLQSPLDLSYLLNNARLAARAKIDLHLPLQSALQIHPASGPNSATKLGQEDDMRKAVESSVDKYLEQTFEMVRRGVNVNGIEGESVDWAGGMSGPEEFEPYDHDLAKRITSLHATIEQLNLQLATTRRETVGMAARDFEESFATRTKEMDDALALQEEAAMKPPEVEEIKLGWEGREADVHRVWEDGLRNLSELGKNLEGAKDRALQAERVVDYLEGR